MTLVEAIKAVHKDIHNKAATRKTWFAVNGPNVSPHVTVCLDGAIRTRCFGKTYPAYFDVEDLLADDWDVVEYRLC